MGSGSFFYMYTDPALDFGWMSACPGFQDLRHSSRGEGMAEVGMRQVLVDHPLRTMDPLAAALYYIPIWEYTSAVLGMCNGTSHEHRMKNARNTLESSRYFKRSHGADHFWGSSKSQVIAAEMKASNRSLDASSKRPVTLGERMQPLSRSLTRSIVGRYKMFPRPGPTSVGACSFEIPYLPNAVGMRIHQRRRSRHLLSAATARGSQDGHTRADARARLGNSSLLLQFAGSLDVCCTGAHVRCAVAQLVIEPGVAIHPTVRGSTSPGRCAAKALRLLNESASSQSASGGGSSHGASGGSLPQAGGVAASQGGGALSFSKPHTYEAMGHAMAHATFCLTPPGDTSVTSRLYSAIAAGCLPVLPWDVPIGAFKEAARYDDFRVRFPLKQFMREPGQLVKALRAMPAAEVTRRQEAMAAHAVDALYEVPGSRVGDHVLTAALACRNHTMPTRRTRDPSAGSKRGVAAGVTLASPKTDEPSSSQRRL